jgi:hypothetical protein
MCVCVRVSVCMCVYIYICIYMYIGGGACASGGVLSESQRNGDALMRPIQYMT